MLTYDKGKEFCGHRLIDEALKITGSFARPFAGWEQVTIESFKGLFRQYATKQRPMKSNNYEEIKIIENRLNNRLLKRLVLGSPAEVFRQSLSRVMPRARH